MSRLVEGGILTVIFFLVVNVVFLNIYFISTQQKNSAAMTINDTVKATDYINCDENCQAKIIHKISNNITPISNAPITEHEEKVSHEFIIPLGSGTSSSVDYEFINGVESYIDTSLYPNIKNVVFETFMSIPTANGKAYVKLYNVTDKHDVWFSEQTMETNVVTMKEKAISLEKGKKLYRVMLKSTMGYEVKLNNSRIRIITE